MSASLGPYEIRGRLGAGAMAVVWRAWDSTLEREVAIKEPMISPTVSEAVYAELQDRFVKEGRTAARLSHPGIVTIFTADVFDGRPAIVMELLRGHTLATLIDRGSLPFEASMSILDQLLEALDYAHTMGVVHRDVKPDNVFVTEEGRVKLTDFGVAHVSQIEGAHDGAIAGTPGYMSPEQINAQPVDARSDIFSIGVVAYELCAGRNPFGATDGVETNVIMYNTAHAAVPSLALIGMPPTLAEVVERAMALDPSSRYSSAGEMRIDLQQAIMNVAAPNGSLIALVDEAGAPNMGVSFTDTTLGFVRDKTPQRGSAGWIVGVSAAAALGVLVLLALTSGSGTSSLGLMLLLGGGIGGAVWLMVKQARQGSGGPPPEAVALGASSGDSRSVTLEIMGATESLTVSRPLPVEIGRCAEVGLMLADDMVSRRHARIEWRLGEGVWVLDLGSRNGTFMNGNRLDGTGVLLGPEDVVVVGSTQIRVIPDEV